MVVLSITTDPVSFLPASILLFYRRSSRCRRMDASRGRPALVTGDDPVNSACGSSALRLGFFEVAGIGDGQPQVALNRTAEIGMAAVRPVIGRPRGPIPALRNFNRVRRE